MLKTFEGFADFKTKFLMKLYAPKHSKSTEKVHFKNIFRLQSPKSQEHPKASKIVDVVIRKTCIFLTSVN